MKINQIKNAILYIAAIGVSIFLLFFVITCSWIGYDVKQKCRDAQSQYGGDCTEAFISLLNDENRGYKDRNSAIWALGELGDPRALPVLQSYYTGIIPEREPLNKVISQYELRKAVNLASGGFNMTAFMWKWGGVK
jgi:hypothetical protein